MSDLVEQLRAYGRLIEADLVADAAEGPAPAESGRRKREHRSGARSRRGDFALVAAATAAVILTAALLFPASTPDSGTAVVAGRPVASATSSATDAVPWLFDGPPEIAAGTYAFDLKGVPMEITVPAGWVRHEDFYLTAGPEDTSDGYLSFLDVIDVYKDPCDWSAGKAGIGPTVDDLVAGLQALKGLQTTAPKPLNVDGIAGTELVISTPADLDLSTCHTGTFALWTIAVGGPVDRQIDTRPGDTGTVWILDLDGQRGVISWGSDQSPSQTSAQISEMVGSLKIG